MLGLSYTTGRYCYAYLWILISPSPLVIAMDNIMDIAHDDDNGVTVILDIMTGSACALTHLQEMPGT